METTELDNKIEKLKNKKKAISNKRYYEIGKHLVKEYSLKEFSTDEIKRMISEKIL